MKLLATQNAPIADDSPRVCSDPFEFRHLGAIRHTRFPQQPVLAWAPEQNLSRPTSEVVNCCVPGHSRATGIEKREVSISAARTGIDYGALLKEDRVHGSAYRDPEIFADELAKIFYRGWVYVGHASEVPQPGDFRVTTIGQQSVTMVRDDDGQVQMHTSGSIWGHKQNSERAAK